MKFQGKGVRDLDVFSRVMSKIVDVCLFQGEKMNFDHLKQKELAKTIGVTTKTVARWTQAGMPRNEDKSYNLPKCIEWLLHIKKETKSSLDDESKLALIAFRKERARIVAIERKQLEGKLMSRSEVLEQFIGRAFALKRGLLFLSRRIAHQLAATCQKRYKDVVKVIDDEVYRLLEGYSENLRVGEDFYTWTITTEYDLLRDAIDQQCELVRSQTGKEENDER